MPVRFAVLYHAVPDNWHRVTVISLRHFLDYFGFKLYINSFHITDFEKKKVPFSQQLISWLPSLQTPLKGASAILLSSFQPGRWFSPLSLFQSAIIKIIKNISPKSRRSVFSASQEVLFLFLFLFLILVDHPFLSSLSFQDPLTCFESFT